MKPELFTIGSFTVYGYGFMIAVGFIVAAIVAVIRAKKKGLSADAAEELVISVLLFGFLGEKMLYVIVNLREFFEDPMAVIGSSGFVIYGGLIVGLATGIIYCRRKKISFLQYLDLLIPEVAIAQGFGRIGCHLAGCCHGIETDSAFAVVFPEGSMAPAGVPLVPTQLISAAGGFAIAAVLLIVSRKKTGVFSKNGSIGALYMLLYSVGRFVIEFFRADARGTVGALSTSQFISIFFAAAGIALLLRIRKTASSEAKAEAGVESGSETEPEPEADTELEEAKSEPEYDGEKSEESSKSETEEGAGSEPEPKSEP